MVVIKKGGNCWLLILSKCHVYNVFITWGIPPSLCKCEPYDPRFLSSDWIGRYYTEPKSGIPYASLKALEQIRERPPPWMTLTGSAAFYEATKSLLDGES
jgi:hypothetical protein